MNKEFQIENAIISDSEQNYLEKELYELINENESIFHFIQESASDGLWFLDLNNTENEWMNRRFWSNLGYTPNQMPHTSPTWQKIVDPSDLAKAALNVTKYCDDPRNPYNVTLRFKHKLGHTVWIKSRALLIRDELGRPSRMLRAHTDITSLKQAEQKLQKQIAKYEHIINETNMAIWEWNIQTGETIFNDQWAEIQGYTLAELQPTTIDTWLNLLHPDDLKNFNGKFDAHLNGETDSYECKFRLKHKSGKWIWIRSKGKIISQSASGDNEWIIGTHKEIPKNNNEIELQQTFIEQAPTAIAVLDVNMCYLSYSKKWLSDYNIKESNILGKSHYEIFPEIGDDWKADHQDCLNGKTLQSDEDRFVRADGSVQWITWELRPWYTNSNTIGGVIMYTADITRLKEIENELKISVQTFKSNFDNSAFGMAIMSLDGVWKKVNPTLCNIYGYSEQELSSMSFQDLTHPADINIGKQEVKEILTGDRSYFKTEKRYVHKNGQIIYAVLFTSLVRDAENKPLHFLVQINDISPRILAKEKLQQTINTLEGILESSTHVSIIGTDSEGLITTFNKGSENLLGYSKEEMILKQSLNIIHLESEVISRGQELSEVLGEEINGFDVFVTLPQQDGYETREWTYVHKNGFEFPVQLTVTPIKENNIITGYLGVATEIFEIKKAEKEVKSLLNVAEEQNGRLKNFAHIVSHNLRSHSGNFGMLLDLYLEENKMAKDDEIIKLFIDASDNLAETIEHLNEVVLINTTVNGNFEPINLLDHIEKIKKSISQIASDSNVCIHNLIEPSVSILGLPAYIDSILLNFITNGIKYSSKDVDSHIILSTFQHQNYLVLCIEDNGLGMDLDIHGEKLFGMYKTFHDHKDARGIGLFITKNQIEAMGGHVEVDSEVNKGTTFKIYFKYEKN